MCRNEFKGNNHFDSRNFTNEIWALETPETRKSSKGLSVTLCVNVQYISKWSYLMIQKSQSAPKRHFWPFCYTFMSKLRKNKRQSDFASR